MLKRLSSTALLLLFVVPVGELESSRRLHQLLVTPSNSGEALWFDDWFVAA